MAFGLIGKVALGAATVGSSGIAGTYAIEKFALREKTNGKKKRQEQNSAEQGTGTPSTTVSTSPSSG